MIDPLSFWLNACKCPLQLSRITAVILVFSSVKGTNPQILPQKCPTNNLAYWLSARENEERE